MDAEFIKRFFGAVREMRQFQKSFFKDRKPSDLESSKAYEQIVDRMVAEYNSAEADAKHKAINQTLF